MTDVIYVDTRGRASLELEDLTQRCPHLDNCWISFEDDGRIYDLICTLGEYKQCHGLNDSSERMEKAS